MVELFVNGNKIGTLPADSAKLARLIEEAATVEFRSPTGGKLGVFVPDLPGRWNPSITEEELDRRKKEPGLTFDEVKKRLGWE